jgi:hypothetical protein
MADGADLLVARTALELGLEVDAVLPVPLESYASDFAPETFEGLKSTLQHPNVRSVELSLPGSDRSAAVPDEGTQRDEHYLNLARTLVKTCNLLLVIWDGDPCVRAGGTADTLLRYLGLRTDRKQDEVAFVSADVHAEDVCPSRLAYWIPAGRGTRMPDATAPHPCYLSGLGEDGLQRWVFTPKPLKEQLAELDTHNHEYEQLAAKGSPPAAPDSLIRGLPKDLPLPAADQPFLRQIDTEYGKADALAVYFQKRSDRLFAFFSVTALVMGLAFLAYEKFVENRILLITYLAILLSSLGLYLLLHGRRWFAKHLMYRALAETLRARFYLSLADADHLVDTEEVLSLSGIDRFRGFGWITLVLTSLEEPAMATHRTAPRGDASLAGVDVAWIESQRQYFISKVARLERSSRNTRQLKRILFAVILVVIASLIFLGEFADRAHVAPGVPLKNALTFAMALLALLLGVWELHQSKMATRELLWQYRNQLNHFSQARARLAQTSTSKRRRQVLAQLGKDSLMESYLWTIHRYHREHEPPGKG